MGLNKYAIERINERYSVVFETRECRNCGSLQQVASFYEMQDGRPSAQLVCLRCGYFETLPKYTYPPQPVDNRLSDWSNIVRNNDDRRCHICGSETKVAAHHIIPKAHDPQGHYWYLPTNGIALCERCHELVHGEWMTKYRKEGRQD